MAYALREAFDGQISVLTPDLLLHPTEALTRIRTIINQKHPDWLLGNSCGALLTATLHAALELRLSFPRQPNEVKTFNRFTEIDL